MVKIKINREIHGFGVLAYDTESETPEQAYAYAWDADRDRALDALLLDVGLTRIDLRSRPESLAPPKILPTLLALASAGLGSV
jgi:hypothetical protein